MGSRTVRGAALALGVVLTAALVQAPAQSAAAVAVPAVSSPSPKAAPCQYALSEIKAYRDTSAFVPPNQLILLGGASKTVNLDTLDLYRSPYQDPSQTLWYRALTWLAMAAVDASEKGDKVTADTYATAMIGAVNRAPDLGSATPTAKAYSKALGWDAGTTIRRSEALMCLAAHTGVNPLRPLLVAHATALIDPNRYGGPPLNRVGNAGIMANLTLIDIGRLLGRSDYVNLAVGRLVNDHPKVFSPLGWAYEGSTHYQSVNIRMWQKAESLLRSKGYIPAANSIAARLALALHVSAEVVGPTGLPVMIGNTRADTDALRPNQSGLPVTWVDQEGGIAIGRWSFTNPRTTFWTAQNRATRGSHGHPDNTALTWQTLRVPVLLDGGQYDYFRSTSPLTIWSLTPTAQNRAVPRRMFREASPLQDITLTRSGRVDDLLMHTNDLGPLQTRRAIIDDRRGVLHVNDATETRQTQYFQMAPGWKVVKNAGTDALLRHTTGARLRVYSPDGKITSLSGSMNPVGGWFAVAFATAIPVPQLVITGLPSMTTTFDFMTKNEADTPPPVIDRKSMSAGVRRARFEWVPGANTKKVQGYRIQVNVAGSGWTDLVTDTESTDTTRVVRKLANDTKHRFRVATLTKRGISQYSAPSRLVTPGKPTVGKRTEPES